MEKPIVHCTTTSTTTTKLGSKKHIYRKDNIRSHKDAHEKPFQASFEKNNSVNLNYLMGWEYHRMWHNEIDEYKKDRKKKDVVKKFKPVLIPKKKKPEEPKKLEKFTLKRFQNIASKVDQKGVDLKKNRTQPQQNCVCSCHKSPHESHVSQAGAGNSAEHYLGQGDQYEVGNQNQFIDPNQYNTAQYEDPNQNQYGEPNQNQYEDNINQYGNEYENEHYGTGEAAATE